MNKNKKQRAMHNNHNISRSDMTEILATKFKLDNKQTEKAMRLILTTMINSLAKKQRIEVRGFGSFEVRTRTASQARNPKTGEKITIAKQHVVHFKPGANLKEKINRYVRK